MQVMWLKAPLRRVPIVNFFDAMPYDPDTGLFFVSDDAGMCCRACVCSAGGGGCRVSGGPAIVTARIGLVRQWCACV